MLHVVRRLASGTRRRLARLSERTAPQLSEAPAQPSKAPPRRAHPGSVSAHTSRGDLGLLGPAPASSLRDHGFLMRSNSPAMVPDRIEHKTEWLRAGAASHTPPLTARCAGALARAQAEGPSTGAGTDVQLEMAVSRLCTQLFTITGFQLQRLHRGGGSWHRAGTAPLARSDAAASSGRHTGNWDAACLAYHLILRPGAAVV